MIFSVIPILLVALAAAQTPNITWQVQVPSEVQTPGIGALHKVVVITPYSYSFTAQAYIMAYNVTSGQLLWNFTAARCGVSIRTPQSPSLPVVIIEDTLTPVAIWSPNGVSLCALQLLTGKLQWNSLTLTNRKFPILHPPMAGTVGAKSLVFARTATHVHALDAATGASLWNRTQGSCGSGNVMMYEKMLILGGCFQLTCVDAGSGTQIWSHPLTTPDGDVPQGLSTPIVDQDKVGGLMLVAVYGEVPNNNSVGGVLTAVDMRYMDEVWSINTPGMLMNPLATAVTHTGSSLIFAAVEHSVYAFDFATGDVAWSFNTTNTIDSNVVVSQGVVIAVRTGNDGRRHALGLRAVDGTLGWTGSCDMSHSGIAVFPGLESFTIYYGAVDPITGVAYFSAMVIPSL